MPKDLCLQKALKQYFGFDAFKDSQEAIIRSLLERKNVFVLMPTGGGKSLCYQLPALLMDGVAIVISPLIALMKNQVDAVRTSGEDDSVAHFLRRRCRKGYDGSIAYLAYHIAYLAILRAEVVAPF